MIKKSILLESSNKVNQSVLISNFLPHQFSETIEKAS